jgi:hypothetical protein
MRRCAAACFAAGLAGAALASEPAATPYRPTLSNPAELSAPGHLELEAGWQRETGGGERRAAVPWLAKYAFSEDFGLLLGGEAAVWLRDAAGVRSSGHGDVSLALKFRRPLDGTSALGLEVGARLATASDGLGSGRNDYTVNGIYSGDFGPLRGDLNLGYTRLGDVPAGEGRDEAAWAIALSRALGVHWGAAAELSGTARRGARPASQFLAAVSYSVSPTLVLDAGAATALGGGAPDWTAFLGFTWLPR